jgi:hypothetical protein
MKLISEPLLKKGKMICLEMNVKECVAFKGFARVGKSMLLAK